MHSIAYCVSFLNLTHGRNRGGFRPMSGWITKLARVDEVLRSDSRLGTCAAIVQFAVSVRGISGNSPNGSSTSWNSRKSLPF
jgi:hypothetical protein